jgi:hypothetical protein
MTFSLWAHPPTPVCGATSNANTGLINRSFPARAGWRLAQLPNILRPGLLDGGVYWKSPCSFLQGGSGLLLSLLAFSATNQAEFCLDKLENWFQDSILGEPAHKHRSHLARARMSGYDLPAVLKLLKIHGRVAHECHV